VVIAFAGIGWPGFVAWDARAALIGLTLPGPLAWLLILGAVAPIAIYARLLVVGLGRPTDIVTRGQGERPTWPAPMPTRPMQGRGGMERAFERTNHAIGGGLDLLWTVPAGVRANRSLIAGVLVVSLAVLSFTVSAGGLGVSAAAAAAPVQGGELPTGSEPPIGSEPPGSAPAATSSPGAGSSGGPSFEPLPTF
jgi:hypothetical protein